MYGFPVWTMPPADRLALLDFLPAALAQKRELANGFDPRTADALRSHVLAITGDNAWAESAVLAWREARLEAGLDVV